MQDDDENKVLTLVTKTPGPVEADHIPTALRRIADAIENDEYGIVTSGVLCLGHTYEEADGGESSMVGERYAAFGLGPRHDPFTVRGLLLTCANDLTGTIE